MRAGVFSADSGVPDWADFALLNYYASPQELAAAAQVQQARLSQGRPFDWVLNVCGDTMTHPVEANARSARDRMDAAGLTPSAIIYSEEWYREDNLARFPGAGMARIDAACQWIGEQHAVIKSLWPSAAIVGLEQWYCDVTVFGPDWYRPVPAHTDIIAVEGYVPAGLTWNHPAILLDAKLAWATGTPYTYVDPVSGRVVTSRQTRPVVLIAQGFRNASDPQWHQWPTGDTVLQTALWVPKVAALWVFDWTSYRNGAGQVVIEGCRDWVHGAAALRAWGVTS